VLVELCGDEALRAAGECLSASAIEFNYLGQFDGTLNRTTAFRAATEFPGKAIHPANKSRTPISINGMVHGGRLGFTVDYNQDCGDPRRFGDAFKEALLACVAFSTAANLLKSLQNDAEAIVVEDRSLLEQGIEI
jgi:non-ribosomal peptide synthase protein (TIGR01720 family)